MKIKNIEIHNFSGITDLSISPDKITVFLGKTGSGKSSVLGAIRYAMTGKADQYDIRNGEKSASVLLEFADGTTLQRTRTPNGSTVKCNGKRATAKATAEFIQAKFGTDADAFEALCGTDYLEALNQKETTALFLRILPVKITFEMICKMAAERKGSELSDEAKNLLAEKFLGCGLTKDELEEYPTGDTFDLDDIEAAYKSVYEERKVQKKVVAELTARVKTPDPLPKESRKELEDQLYQIASREAEAKAYQKSLDAYNRSVKARDDAVKKQEKLKADLERFKDAGKPDESAKVQAEEDKAKFQAAINKCRDAIGTLQANIDLFERTLSSLDKPVCPISEKLVCTTDKSGLKKDLTEMVAKNQEQKKANTDFIARCEEQIRKRDAIVKKYNDDNVRFLQKDSIERQINSITVPELLEKPKEVKTIDFTAEKKAVNDKISLIAAHEAANKAAEQLKAAQVRLAALETCVEVLDVKTGIRSMILKKALAPFEALVNDKASKIRPDFNVKFSCEDGICILVSPRKESGYVPLKKVSTGEFAFVAYLLMGVINQITNARFLMIDSIDKLDRDYMDVLLGLLADDNGFDNVFIGGVDHPDTVQAAEAAGKVVVM